MRLFTTLLCGLFLLVSLSGLTGSERSAHGLHAGALHVQPLMPDALCGEAAGHGSCQLVISEEHLLFSLREVAGSSQFDITPVMASGRSFAPHTPPPRRLS